MKDVGRFESRPDFSKSLGRRSKVVATCGKSSTINRSRGSASYDRKRIALGSGAFQFANALEHTGLISAASTAARYDKTDRVFHRTLSLSPLWEHPV